MRPILILAKTRAEADFFAQEHHLPPSEYRYIESRAQLLSLDKATKYRVARVGEYWLHPCNATIEEDMAALESTPT